MKKLAALLAAILLLSSTANAEQAAFVTLANRDGRLNVRTAPEGEIISKLYDGEDVIIVETCDGWALIRYRQSEDPVGWVSLDYLHPYGAPAEIGGATE